MDLFAFFFFWKKLQKFLETFKQFLMWKNSSAIKKNSSLKKKNQARTTKKSTKPPLNTPLKTTQKPNHNATVIKQGISTYIFKENPLTHKNVL